MATDIKKIVNGLQASVDEYNAAGVQQDSTKQDLINLVQKETAIINAVNKLENDQANKKEELQIQRDHNQATENAEIKRNELEKARIENSKKLEDDKLEFEKNRLEKQSDFDKEKLEFEKSRLKAEETANKEKIEIEKSRLKAEETANKDRIKIEERKLDNEKQVNKDRNDFDNLRLEFEKQKLALDQRNLEMQNEIRKDNRKFQWISLGITAGTALIGFLIKLKLARDYNKLAYANLKLIYIDEGRPTTEWKDSVKNVKDIIRQ